MENLVEVSFSVPQWATTVAPSESPQRLGQVTSYKGTGPGAGAGLK